jgi:molybdopterin converting factor small subunit
LASESQPGIIARYASGRAEATPAAVRTRRIREQRMITVQVKLFATLRRNFPHLGIGEALAVELAEDATVGELVEKLKLPKEAVKVIFVNSTVRRDAYRLEDGDEVGIFPPVGGG